MPDLEQMHREYRDRGVAFLGVATHGESAEKVRTYLQAHDITFPVVLDDHVRYYNYFWPEAQGLRGLAPFPLQAVIDPEGRVVTVLGSYRPDVLRDIFESAAGNGGEPG